MKDLDIARAKQNDLEKKQGRLVFKYLEQKRKKFEYADSAHFLLENKNEEDLIFLSEKISEWHEKAKKENKNLFLDVLMAVFRIQSYCTTLQTISKQSVSEYCVELDRCKRLESEMTELKLSNQNEKLILQNEIKKLNQEIEFIGNNGV